LALEHGLRKGTRKLFTVIVLAFASSAYAFTETVTSSGTPVRWKTQDGGFKFNLAGNPINASGLDSEDFRQAVVTGLQRWQAASGPPLNFDYWQGTDDSIYLPNSDYNGLSSIYFASHGGKGQGLTPNILGLTQVWYNTTNGEILEADTVLNDRDFHFTMNPQDTSGYGSKKSTFQGSDRVYIENVITHELGHSLGFSHAGGLQSTMLFMESPEEADATSKSEFTRCIRAEIKAHADRSRATSTRPVARHYLVHMSSLFPDKEELFSRAR
jgi:hypothetical protein